METNQTKKMTLDEIMEAFVETMGNPLDYEINKDEQFALFVDLGKVDGLEDWLRTAMGEDIKRHFKAGTDEQRAHVKGEFGRTLKILVMLRKTREMEALNLKRKNFTAPVAQRV